jgi:hypothetical protein
MCSIGMIDRQPRFPHSGCGGVPREHSTWPIARLLRKEADQKGEVGSFQSFQERKTGGTGAHSPALIELRVYFGPWVLIAEHLDPLPIDVNVFPVAKDRLEVGRVLNLSGRCVGLGTWLEYAAYPR